MIEYSIQISDRSALDNLDKLKGAAGQEIQKKAMMRIGEGCVSWTQTKKLRGQVLRRQSGNLANSVQYRLVGYNKLKVGAGMVYGAAHEFGIPLSAGKYIYPKNAKALRFKVGGDTIYRKRVRQHVVKRPYVAPSIQEYFNSGKATVDVERLLQREIDRINGV